jgi:uncharacterized protein (TIGR02246 family)
VTAQLTDHEQIQQLLARFIQLRDDKRFDEWAQLFTEDGTFEYPGARVTGRDAIRDNVADLLRSDRGKHLGFNAVIEVNGDTASVVSDVVKLRPAEPGSDGAFVVQTAGRYIDALVRTADGWRVASRRTELLGFPARLSAGH